MTEEDQDAAIGRMVSRFSEAKKRRVALLSEADTIGRTLKTIGNDLESAGSVVAFQDRDARSTMGKPDLVVRPFPEAARVNELLTELREVSAEIRQLRASLKDAGLSVE